MDLMRGQPQTGASAGQCLGAPGIAAWRPLHAQVAGPLDDVVVAVLVLRYVGRRLGHAELRRRWHNTPDGDQPG